MPNVKDIGNTKSWYTTDRNKNSAAARKQFRNFSIFLADILPSMCARETKSL